MRYAERALRYWMINIIQNIEWWMLYKILNDKCYMKHWMMKSYMKYWTMIDEILNDRWNWMIEMYWKWYVWMKQTEADSIWNDVD